MPENIISYYNQVINENLSRNKGKYHMVSGTPMAVGIGEIAPVYWGRDYLPQGTLGLGLMGFTDQLEISSDGYTGNVRRNMGGEYQSRRYVPNNNLMDTLLELLGLSERDFANSSYDNYLDYINAVYLNDHTWMNTVQEWLDRSTMKGTLQYSKVGVVRDIDIYASLAGVNVTNVNNFSGQDTPLGSISNRMYALNLHWGAYFNTVRNTPHVTKDIDSYIGLNEATEAQIANIFRNSEFGRVSLDSADPIRKAAEATYSAYVMNYMGEDTKMYLARNLEANNIDKLARKCGNGVEVNLSFRYGLGYGFTYEDRFNETGGSYGGRLTDMSYMTDAPKGFSVNENNTVSGDVRQLYSKADDGTYTFDSDFSPSTKLDTVYQMHAEGDTVGSGENKGMTGVYNAYGDQYSSFGNSMKYEARTSLVKKTRELFRARKIATLIGRFHTTEDTSPGHTEKTLTNSAVSKYGISHGRNLLNKAADTSNSSLNEQKINGYGNPYCRVWTYHHQYDRITRLIRPFTDTDANGNDTPVTIKDLQKNWDFSRGVDNKGGDYLAEWTSLKNNGFVRITPSNESGTVDPRKCMFAIENLAWKDVLMNDETMDVEQRGPLGGRIMWFPPYNLKFSENVSVNVESTNFIGRGEPVYTYTNTERSGSLQFSIVVDHPSILDYWDGRNGSASRTETQLENDLLRFFAGCDQLSGKSDTVIVNVEENNPEPVPEIVVTPVVEPPEDIIVNIFFPNNYSGVDDTNVAGWNGMDYLFYGVQCGKICVDDTVQDFNPYNLDGSQTPLGYEMGDEPVSLSTSGCPYIGIEGRNGKVWQYRIDNEYVAQQLVTTDGYRDTASYKLNSALVEDSGYNTATHTFAELYCAISGQDDSALRAQMERVGGDWNRVLQLRDKLANREIVEVTVYGVASSHGNNASAAVNLARNSDLSSNRRDSAIEWIREWMRRQRIDVDIQKSNVESIKKVKNPTVSSREAKLARYAQVKISLANGISIAVRNTQQSTMTVNSGSTQSRSVRTPRNSEPSYHGQFAMNFEKFGTLSQVTVPYTGEDYVRDRTTTVTASPSVPQTTVPTDGILSMKLQPMGANRPQEVGTRTENGVRMVTSSKTVVKKTNKRYGNEYRFFNELPTNAPMVYRQIKEKIKFFNPVFHSITPEGFNSRLTFLHQCTRQGPTISSSDRDGFAATASNLSFGRMPFCVLRIGDFFNTRIIIDSLSIDYDPLVWDLNPEGIGVQPMIANVSMNFRFVGGSSLSGPIVKLQNAVSFNFYGNTPVYDNRADRIDYGVNGSVSGYTEWLPTMISEQDYWANENEANMS